MIYGGDLPIETNSNSSKGYKKSINTIVAAEMLLPNATRRLGNYMISIGVFKLSLSTLKTGRGL